MNALPSQITSGRVFGYLRLSTDEGKQGNSFDVQREHITKRFHVDGWFSDTVSGSVDFDKRQGWVELMQQIEPGDTIAVLRLDRISRNTLNFLVVENKLKSMDIKLEFIEGVSGTDPMDELVRTILMAVGQLERSMIAKRISQTKKLQRERGEYLGGGIPFGYAKEKRDGKHYLVEDEKQMDTVQKVLSLYEEGLSLRKISAHLEDKCIYNKIGRPMSAVSIRNIIQYHA